MEERGSKRRQREDEEEVINNKKMRNVVLVEENSDNLLVMDIVSDYLKKCWSEIKQVRLRMECYTKVVFNQYISLDIFEDDVDDLYTKFTSSFYGAHKLLLREMAIQKLQYQVSAIRSIAIRKTNPNSLISTGDSGGGGNG